MLSIAGIVLALVLPQDPPLPAAEPKAPTAYDPLAVAEGDATSLTLSFRDERRDRTIPVRVYLPAATTPAPVIVWSHGLGGSRDNSPYLGTHWSKRGYVCVFLQHPGSDEAVWRDAPLRERMGALRAAASMANLRLRCEDVGKALDQIALWHADDQHELHGRLDLERVGMCGHSFGAQTTQCVGGQSAPLVGARFRDDRIDAALPMSPAPPARADVRKAFGDVRIPWLLMTGTHDGSPIDDRDPATRREVYPALPTTIDRYELVLHEAEHSAFADVPLRGETKARKATHHRSILALSTAFWDCHLRGDAAARAWLHGDDPRRVLDAEDLWQRSAGKRPQ
ncbi:MAG: dienelactone hydrolase [Phycisphaerales bacterium]|jgi:predicted dienelactone hydrolase|nr:dienelactone hydrolase [Phycisphaerales bacterium]